MLAKLRLKKRLLEKDGVRFGQMQDAAKHEEEVLAHIFASLVIWTIAAGPSPNLHRVDVASGSENLEAP